MQVEYIKEADAPKPPKPLSKSATQVVEIVNGIKDGQVAKVTPAEGQSLRGLKTSFSRVTKARNLKVQTWSVEGDDSLYVRKVK